MSPIPGLFPFKEKTTMTAKIGEQCVRDLMTPNAIVVSEHDSVVDAFRKFELHGISALPVVNERNQVTGILSVFDVISITREMQSDLNALPLLTEESRDFLIQMLIHQGDQNKVAEVMTQPVRTIEADANLVFAAREMIQNGFRHLPVVDDVGHPIGMISTTDFVRAIAETGALLAG